jgi:hypothetical protein
VLRHAQQPARAAAAGVGARVVGPEWLLGCGQAVALLPLPEV